MIGKLRIIKNHKGSTAVFLLIVMAVLVPLCGIMLDMARFGEAVKISESSLKICAESMLAAYDRQLKEQFGLLAMHPRDAESIEKEVYELLSDNLTPDNPDGKVTDLYGFKVNRVEVTPLYNLSEPYVLEQQVAEFMKYRAPAQAVSGFVEKLKTMAGLMNEADLIGRNMSLDKMLNEFRKDLIHFTLLLQNKMKSINDSDMKTRTLNLIMDNNKQSEELCKKAGGLIVNVNNAVITYRDKKKIRDVAQNGFDQAESALDRVSGQIDDVNYRISLINRRLAEENDISIQEKKSLIIEIGGLEAELAALQPIYEAAASEYAMDRDYLLICAEESDKAKEQLAIEAGRLLECYNGIKMNTEKVLSSLNMLLTHLRLHYEYHLMAVELAEGLIPKFEAIESEKALMEASIKENEGSGVSSRIGADIIKKMQTLDKDLFRSMILRFETNKVELESWVHETEISIGSYLSDFDWLDREIKKLGELKDNPGDGVAEVIPMTVFDDNQSIGLALEGSLAGLDSYPAMSGIGIYQIPEYQSDPKPIDSENKEFEIWYSKTFSGLDPAIQGVPAEQQITENTDLQKARDNMSGTAKGIVEEKPDNEGMADLGMVEFIGELMGLPSYLGHKDSDESIEKVAAETVSTQAGESLNPFFAEAKGTETVNENEKNFFDYELERTRNLLTIVNELFDDSIGSMMKSLYMNEYIVSAFKCATTENNRLEYDIGWDRPLDSTFFKKGEVEYVLFGNISEAENIAASKRSIFAVRLMFNLLHVYTDPVKLMKTMEIAAVIAGWTIFGVPVVQNFLLISWAAMESYVDSEKLTEGKEVPLIKTAQSWYLEPARLKDYLVNTALRDLKNLAMDSAGNVINDGAAYLEEMVTSFINARVEELFAPIEKVASNLSDKTPDIDIKTLIAGNFRLDSLDGSSLDSFILTLSSNLDVFIDTLINSLKDKGKEYLSDCKEGIKTEIRNLIFKSQLFIGLKEKIKNFSSELINKGMDAVSVKIDSVLGTRSGRKSGGNNVLGRLIMMDYDDYLRLMLLAVPAEVKSLRTADLIQLDMRITAPDSSKPIGQYNTCLYIKAYIDINFWFIPEGLYKRGSQSMIVAEWTQGY